MKLDVKEIMKIIPHRYPMLLIDKIEELEPGVHAVGYKNVTMNEIFFQGHFPDNPIMPGVLIIEALAQVGAVALLCLEKFKGKTPLFGGIKSAKFKGMVVPGDVLKLEVHISKLRGTVGIGTAVAMVDDKEVAEAELIFALI